MKQFRNKVVLLTGAAGGLGRAIAQAFAREGADLALLDRDEAGLTHLAQTCRARGGQVSATVADLSTAPGVRQGIEAVLEPYQQQVDILIANVGMLIAGRFEDLSDEELALSMAINFWSHVWACRAVLPVLRERVGATILLVGSDQGSQPDVGLFPYAQAKAALHSLAKLLAREYAPGVRVNALAPGMARTPLVQDLFARIAHETRTDLATAERLEIHQRGIPLRRLAEPEEVAEAALFLVQHPFCTGTILDLSGGQVRGGL